MQICLQLGCMRNETNRQARSSEDTLMQQAVEEVGNYRSCHRSTFLGFYTTEKKALPQIYHPIIQRLVPGHARSQNLKITPRADPDWTSLSYFFSCRGKISRKILVKTCHLCVNEIKMD